MTVRVRVGVVLTHPIQYLSPLFDLLAARGVVDLKVAYGNDASLRNILDPGFGESYQWDIDLVSGHPHEFLTRGPEPSHRERAKAYRRLLDLVRSSDVVIINGYVGALAVATIAACQLASVPYLLRSDTSTRAAHPIMSARYWWPRVVSKRSAGGLSMGVRNSNIHRALGSPRVFHAPYTIDVERFREAASRIRVSQGTVRQTLGVPEGVPIVAFGGKFIEAKRPQDVIYLANRMQGSIHVLMIGSGPLLPELRSIANGLPVTFAGFLNQTKVPEALGCADVLVLPSSYEPWGLIVNEAMASGCVPVVSDRVGCSPDLVAGLGEVFAVGDIDALTVAVERALSTAVSSDTPDRLAERLQAFTLESSASGYESAVLAVTRTT